MSASLLHASGEFPGPADGWLLHLARARFALDTLDSHAAAPDDLDRMVPNPVKKAAAHVRRAEALAEVARQSHRRGHAPRPSPDLASRRPTARRAA